MTTPTKGRRISGAPPATDSSTVALLHALADGCTMEEMEQRLGLSERTIRRRLLALEESGVRVDRPEGTRWSGPGRYGLESVDLAQAIREEVGR